MKHFVHTSVLSLVLSVWTGGITAFAQEVVLAPGDVVQLSVYGRDDLSGERTVDPAGNVGVPLLGRLNASGRTPAELEAAISRGLVENELIVSPSLFVDVVRWRDVFVTGDVPQPGAFTWRPGLTLRQAVALAGGSSRLPKDELGSFLQAYSAIERAGAAELAIGSLTARRARLDVELAFVNALFEQIDPDHFDLPEALNAAAVIEDDEAALTNEALEAAFLIRMAAVDHQAFAELIRIGIELIAFPAQIAMIPALDDVRETQQRLIMANLSTHLATEHSLKLRRASLKDVITYLEQQNEAISEAVLVSRERLGSLLTLKDQGLMRLQDLQDSQTSYSQLLATQISINAQIAETRVSLEQIDLQLRNFVPLLRQELSREREQLIATLGEQEARRASIIRAADIARRYLDLDLTLQGDRSVTYEINRTANGESTILTAEESTPILPGDTIVIGIQEGL
ncbi:polysaccharide biosynthesis/export family protein [Roseovarius sp. S4756]|uniref:polysaccharide biosynthesis/export family protein n=1 Tax=Roseovarius maritimus TaxID=3342637 RepID=UPI00372781B9